MQHDVLCIIIIENSHQEMKVMQESTRDNYYNDLLVMPDCDENG